ncbi:4Fe-4S binding protein [Desulfovibrio sp. OttesenSCG-928-M14]|nr:4Fe-4S binding protein [Desulfovibrio sp. OttesenSCG-928-M16]MDL2216721.1 4Fe-4S binding protein [Desulfovibrio sp. OttesenSCG-928-M14]
MAYECDSRTLYIEYSKCIGCETCEMVCKFLYNQPRIVLVRTVGGEMLPLYCRHCEHPHCAKVCKKGAITQDESGAVIRNSMQCRGCESRNCILGCPYGGMLATGEGIGIAKCDLCADRRKNGSLPACVEMCPCGAITYIERSVIPSLATKENTIAEERLLAHVRQKAEKK